VKGTSGFWRVPERGVLNAPAEKWDRATQRATVIRELAGQSAIGLDSADAAAEFGVSRRHVYTLVRRWREGEGLVSDLLPGTSSGGRVEGRARGRCRRNCGPLRQGRLFAVPCPYCRLLAGMYPRATPPAVKPGGPAAGRAR
jgi:hypothetical protein